MKPKLPILKGLLSTSCTQSIKLILVLFFVFFQVQIQAQSEEELKKQAEDLFEEEEYTKAYKLYSQLVSNNPREPLYNYRLGVCMIYSEPDKKKSFSYLNKAYNNRQDLPKDVTFFLGKAYHINYLFDEAIKYYNEFKKEAPASMQKKLQVDREIMACGNGKRLLSALTDLEVITKKQLNESDYFRSYDLNSSGGKLLVKTDAFKTSYDKKKKEKSVMYSNKAGDRLYFSSYGDNNANGRDIYYRERMSNGEFGKPVRMDGINTEFDEDYPFVHPNGKILYFASKGHNSMGGYDIFKSTFNESTQSWSTPKNMEFPINSPDDDYLFVTDTSEKFAYFSTGRYSPPGKIDVLKIKTERRPIDLIVMKGTVSKETAKQSVKSKITVKNISNETMVGTFEADDNGNFNMQLPNGAKLLYTVETPGLRTQSQGISLPLAVVGRPFKQTVTYEDGVLKIVNNFEEAPSDDNYLQYLKLIEEKSKLNPNEGQNKLSPDVAKNEGDTPLANNETKDPKAVSTTNPTASDTKTNTKDQNTAKVGDNKTKSNEGINNKEIIDIAKQDAVESEKEAIQLNQDAKDAIELGNAKKIEAETKLKDAETALANAEAITDETQKVEETKKAVDQKNAAQNDVAVANKLLELGKTLEADAANKREEAALNKKYADELEKLSSGKNNDPNAQQKLVELQKQIADVSSKRNESENKYTDLKNEIVEKEKEIAVASEKSSNLTAENNELKNDITKAETELSNTRKKKEKAELTTRINDLKTEQQKVETALTQNQELENKLSLELSALKNELALTDKVKNENYAKVETPSASTNTTQAIAKTDGQKLEDKYASKINITDPSNKDNISDVNNQLTSYNKEIDALIAKNKTQLAKTKKPEEKKSISADIKNLEATKKQNQQSIANNTNRINELNKQIASGTAPQNPNQNLKEINTENPSKAMDQLKELKNSLTQADNALFNFNNYSNSNVQTKKVQADGQINDAFALQNKLKETITNSEATIQNSSVSLPKNSNNPEAILQQADELSNKASKLRSDASTKQGQEKDNLIAQAVELEKQAEAKQIEASETSAKITQDKFDVNKENVQTLLATNKADEGSVNQSKALLEEAEQALKQAKAIREEANAMNNNSAKIGNLGNAEEKELIALNKQNEALTILKNANPGVTLKPYKDLNTVNITNETVLKEEIAKINADVKKLVEAKTTAFKTLSEANDEELVSQNSNLQNNPTISSTPALKSQLAVINKNNGEISALKTKVEQSANETEKLVNLNNLVKKQNETLTAINKLNSDTEAKTLATNKTNDQKANNNTGNDIANNNTKSNETKDNTTDKNNTKDNTTDVSKNNTGNDSSAQNANTASDPTVVQPLNNISAERATTSFTLDLSYENHKDTSLNQINSFFTTNNFDLRNEQANNLKNGAINNLKGLESENNQLNEEIAKANSVDASAEGSLNNTEIQSKINSLLNASDNMAQEANNLRNESNSKSGEEKTALLDQAKAMDDQSFAKKVEAAQLTQQYNEANFNANNNAINDMLAKLNASDPASASALKAKQDEIEQKRKQAKNIREEANALTNNNARLGAIGNAEEEEAQILQKQTELINELKKSNPDYVFKEPAYSNLNKTKDLPADLKQKQNDLYNKQAAELTNLTNAFSLEYETNKGLIPRKLNADQQKLRSNVENLNSESKNLLIRSTKATTPEEKIKLLSLAAKTGHTAATQLNILVNKQSAEGIAAVNNKVTAPAVNETIAKTNDTKTKDNKTGNNTTKTNDTKSTDVAATNKTKNNTKTKDNTSGNNNTKTTETKTSDVAANTTKENTTTPTETAAGTKVIARIEGLEVLNKNAYNENKPIPVDAKMPDGLIFRVQIGAFKTKIANNSFRGLTPVNGETTTNGYIRYTAGNFNKIENASAVKGDLNNNGYPDAFVVAFFNGKRITVAEALEIMKNEGKTVNLNAPLTAGISENVNPNNTNTPTKAVNDIVVVTKELEKTKNLLFTVQIGVYSRQISKARLSNLTPIYSELLPNGLYRYTAGIYTNAEKLISDKNRVIDLGIKDAFVSAYLDGKRLPFNEAKAKKEADASIIFEPENPIIFPTVVPVTTNTAQPVITNVPSPTIAPFSNGVKERPAATPDNGIKENEEGITFKVQIGAYSRQVPADVAAKFNAIKNWPVENKAINGLYIYNIGNFNDAKFAKELKNEAVALGITDAFITVYKDGVKLFGAEATNYLNK